MEAKIKVLFLTKYSSKGPSSRYRAYNYEKYFLENDIIPIYKPLFGDAYIKSLYSKKKYWKTVLAVYYIIKRIIFLFLNAQNYNHVNIEAEIFPHFSFKFDHFFLKKMKSFSLDYDDNISANYMQTKNESKIPDLIKIANFVTVGNHWYFKEFEGNLIYLPTVIDLDKYQVHNIKNKKSELVWIGSPSTSKYLTIIDKTLATLSEKMKFTLKIIGGDINLNEKIDIKNVSWNAETENIELVECSIGIMPLENTYWEKGKCGFKLIQYMASGLPVIGSDLPANEEIIENGVNGYIAKNSEDWLKYLDFLMNNPDVCSRMGKKARERVEQYYSYQVWGEKYVNIIKENV